MEICLLLFFSAMIHQQIYVWYPCLFVFAMSFALLNNCPMYGEFPSDAWLEINAREKKSFSKVKNMYFQQKSNDD